MGLRSVPTQSSPGLAVAGPELDWDQRRMAVDGAIVPPDPPVVKLIFVNLSGQGFRALAHGVLATVGLSHVHACRCTHVGELTARPGARRRGGSAARRLKPSVFRNQKYNPIL